MHKSEPALSEGTCIAALSALARTLGELMASGHAVNVPGVGTLEQRGCKSGTHYVEKLKK